MRHIGTADHDARETVIQQHRRVACPEVTTKDSDACGSVCQAATRGGVHGYRAPCHVRHIHRRSCNHGKGSGIVRLCGGCDDRERAISTKIADAVQLGSDIDAVVFRLNALGGANDHRGTAEPKILPVDGDLVKLTRRAQNQLTLTRDIAAQVARDRGDDWGRDATIPCIRSCHRSGPVDRLACRLIQSRNVEHIVLRRWEAFQCDGSESSEARPRCRLSYQRTAQRQSRARKCDFVLLLRKVEHIVTGAVCHVHRDVANQCAAEGIQHDNVALLDGPVVEANAQATVHPKEYHVRGV